MKVKIQIGKKSQTVKVKTIEEIGKLTYVLHGELLKREITPDICEDKIICKLDDEKIDPKKLLIFLKDKLKKGTIKNKKNNSDKKPSNKDKKNKKDCEKKKKKEINISNNKKNKKKKNKKNEKKISLDFNKPNYDESGRVKLHRI